MSRSSSAELDSTPDAAPPKAKLVGVYSADPPWSFGWKLFWGLLGTPIILLFAAGLALRMKPPYEHLHDFVQEWTSARNFFTDKPIYWNLTESIPHHFGKPYTVLLEYNAHPPAAVLLSLPSGGLDYEAAYLAWNVISLFALAAAVAIAVRPRGLHLNLWLLLPLGVVLLTGNSLAQQINQGQLNLLLLLLIVIAWDRQRQGNDTAAGVLIGLAVAIKVFPAFLFVYFLAQRRFNALLGGVIGFALINGVTAAILGPQAFVDYATVVLPEVSQFRDFWPNASITGYWSKLFDGSSGHVVPLLEAPRLAKTLTAVTVLGVTGVVAWQSVKARGNLVRSDAAFALSVVAMLLVSPITWDHYFLLLLLPAGVYWKLLPVGGAARWTLFAAVVVLCVINPKWIWDATIAGDGELVFRADQQASVAQTWQVLTVVSYQFYALLALLVLCGCWRLSRGKERINAV